MGAVPTRVQFRFEHLLADRRLRLFDIRGLVLDPTRIARQRRTIVLGEQTNESKL